MINLGQFEREQTSKRVALNCHARAMRVFVNGGKAILGLDHNPDDPGILKVKEEEAQICYDSFSEVSWVGFSRINEKRARDELYDPEKRISQAWQTQSRGRLTQALQVISDDSNRLVPKKRRWDR
ncbi:hypothetical protein HW988_14680 [Bdellovibrio sp. KM01]|nr:hypothetical protein HW988_14680 [Bdellovibrio sp. KM01]